MHINITIIFLNLIFNNYVLNQKGVHVKINKHLNMKGIMNVFRRGRAPTPPNYM